MRPAYSILAAALLSCSVAQVQGDTCIKATSKTKKGTVQTTLKTVTRTGACRRGEISAVTGPQGIPGVQGIQGETGPQGVQGAQGPQGDTGADGQLGIYGDGSAGAKTITGVASVTVNSYPNLQFTDVTIDPGATLTVPSGTVFRCTGTFTNNGTIVIQTSAKGAARNTVQGTILLPAIRPAHPGITLLAAGNGEAGDSSAFRYSGSGGTGLGAVSANQIRYPGAKFGGGGGLGDLLGNNTSRSGDGGGSIVVLCRGAITNNGIITADGEDGNGSLEGGGGGGGAVVLASKASVTSASGSTISAKGGAGLSAGADHAPSGGGGGGLIHLLAPVVTTTGATLAVTGGAAGASGAIGSVTANPRSAGGGGGGSVGNGGSGGNVSTDGEGRVASSGISGQTFLTVVDPTALF